MLRDRDRIQTIIASCNPRNGAATTLLDALRPLLADVFFVNMSVTIMACLGFATVLTLLVVPTLYAVFFRIERAPVSA